jgi:exosortase/archaeosortase family protein
MMLDKLFTFFDIRIKQLFGITNTDTIWTLLRFVLFLVLYKASSILWHYLVISPYFIPMIAWGYHAFGHSIVKISSLFFSIFYKSVTIKPDEIIVINNQEVIRMLPACTGLKQLFQIVIILMVYPVKIVQKLVFVIPTILIVFTAALVHFLILVPVAYELPDWFPFFHNNLARIVFFSVYFLIWVGWEKYNRYLYKANVSYH